jgi:hypothetical protein
VIATGCRIGPAPVGNCAVRSVTCSAIPVARFQRNVQIPAEQKSE